MNVKVLNLMLGLGKYFTKYLDSKSSSYEKSLVDKLVPEYEDKILNTTKTSLDDKKSNIRQR